MIKQIVNFIKAYVNGDEARLQLVIEFAWWEVILIVGIISWVIYLLCR